MKKVVIFLMVSALLTASVFAQEGTEGTGVVVSTGSGKLTIGGAVETGLAVTSSTKLDAKGDEDEATSVFAYSDDIGDGTAVRGDVWFQYENGPVGMKVGIRKDIMGTAFGGEIGGQSDDLKLVNAYGWVNLFDSKVKVTAGRIDDSVWGTAGIGDTETDDSFSKGLGLRIGVMPIEGLSFGIFWSGETDYAFKGDADKQPITGSYSIGDFLANTVLGVKYENKDFAFGLDAKYNLPLFDAGSDYDTIGQGFHILAGFKFTGVENLLLVVDGELDYLGAADENYLDTWAKPEQVFYVKGQYDINKELMAGALFRGHHHVRFMPGMTKDVKDDLTVFDFDVRLFGEYKLNDIATARLEAQANFWGLTDMMKDAQEDVGILHSIYVKPQVKFVLAEGFTFVVYDKVTIFDKNFWQNENLNSDKERTGWITNQVQFDFIYTY